MMARRQAIYQERYSALKMKHVFFQLLFIRRFDIKVAREEMMRC